jgi:hypothetical protein
MSPGAIQLRMRHVICFEQGIMIRRHTIISGTGRAGTTFLVQLLTEMGLDTGFKDITSGVHANCNAGMEWDINDPKAPYIIKSPWLCDNLDAVLSAGGITIDHAIVPVRELNAAAESRADVSARTDPDDYPQGVPGGLWHTDEPEQQGQVLTQELYKLMHALARHDIPLTLLYFPRIVNDRDYLFRKLQPIFQGFSAERFVLAFAKTARPDLVHTFPEAPKRGTSVMEHITRPARPRTITWNYY